MKTEIYLVLSASLIGIGLGSALARKNLIAIVLSIATAGLGALIAVSVLGRQVAHSQEGVFFALCLAVVLLDIIIIGCAIAYRRFMATGQININQGNRLRH